MQGFDGASSRETSRLRALEAYDILDTPDEQGFDDIVALAMQICRTPTALVSFVAADRQWFKARAGFPDRQTDLSRSVCRHGLAGTDLLVIPDLSLDPRTRDNPLVAGEPRIRFYAGAPLVTPSGVAIGMLCVIDSRSRPGGLTASQRTALSALAAQVMTLLELRQANALLERQNAFRAQESARFWDTSPDLLLVLGFDGVFQRVNPAWRSVLGYAEDELLGRRFDSLIHPDDLALTEKALTDAAGGALPAVENRYRHTDGSYRWVSWITPPPEDGRIYATGRHVTAEKERAAQLRVFANIVESDTSPVVVWGVDHRLTAFNRAHVVTSKRIYGIDEKVGDPLLDRFVPEQAAVVRGLMDRALAGETFTAQGEFGDPARERPTWDIQYNPLRDASGAIIGGFHRARDVTADLEAAAELARTQEALRQAQKMEAVGQLTGGLAHDFNNLLAGISGALELMGARIRQGRLHDVDKYLLSAQGAAKRAAALTHRLLAFSRRQTLAPKATDVNALIGGMTDLIQRTVGPAVQVEHMGAADLWPAMVDGSQLENALLNLCINARDAMPEGGRITIETANRWIDGDAARERDVMEGQYLSLCVSDTGAGMTPEIVAKAFDPFFTTKPIGQGTGLGLSMIYGFAKQSGGQAHIYSKPGEGATVCIYLPRHFGEAQPDGLVATPLPAASAQAGETVLIVDDEPTVRMLIADILDDLGYTAIEAGDGHAGLKVLQSDSRIDLLVTDVGLPGGMNGRQLADAARVKRPDLKVLFITGFAETALLSDGQLEPGMDVLTKPFAVDMLGARIRKLITERAA